MKKKETRNKVFRMGVEPQRVEQKNLLLRYFYSI